MGFKICINYISHQMQMCQNICYDFYIFYYKEKPNKCYISVLTFVDFFIPEQIKVLALLMFGQLQMRNSVFFTNFYIT